MRRRLPMIAYKKDPDCVVGTGPGLYHIELFRKTGFRFSNKQLAIVEQLTDGDSGGAQQQLVVLDGSITNFNAFK